MIPEYSPAYSEEALEALLQAGKSRRTRARTVVAKLCQFPGAKGDYTVTDSNDVDWEVLVVDDVVLTYRADHAASEFRIALIEWAD